MYIASIYVLNIYHLNGLKGRDKSWFQTLVAFPVEVRIVLIRNEVPAGYAVERPGILIWPKGQPMDAALISGFMGELDLLRDPPDLATMHQLVNYCVRNPWCVTSEDDDRSNRLFALCLQLESGVERASAPFRLRVTLLLRRWSDGQRIGHRHWQNTHSCRSRNLFRRIRIGV